MKHDWFGHNRVTGRDEWVTSWRILEDAEEDSWLVSSNVRFDRFNHSSQPPTPLMMDGVSSTTASTFLPVNGGALATHTHMRGWVGL